jgi:crossover junction endodeoxyribonuclease RuvC
MRVLGVDPGTSATGYGLVARQKGGYRLEECGVIRPTSGDPLAGRLVEIHRALAEVLERLEPEAVAVEGVFYGQNARTAAVLGHARGVAVMTAALRGGQVAEYSPSRIKKAVVGTGNATKEQVGYMVKKHLGLKEPPSPSDAADGCAAALCHLIVGTGAIARRSSG